MRRKIVNWLQAQVRNAGAKGICMGLSGGLDSSVVAALAKEAVGGNRLLGLFLPCHSQPQDRQDALILARALGLKTKTIDLSKAYDALRRLLPCPPRLPKAGRAGEAVKLAQSNLKPRLRMITLYYFANKLNYLVCGTGNKSELSVGYFTKYGDGGVDFLPIGDLFKKDVVKLAKELKIPERIIVKPPTAGLWPGQTDEGEMGITYAELDDILLRMQQNKKQVASRQKVKRVEKMRKRALHKMKVAEICRI